MSMYTTNSENPFEKIYFLNDNNIAFDPNSTSCAAGFNAVASQEEFTEAYGEFGKVSSDLYGLSGKAETSAAALDGKIDAVSASADAKFLPMAGGTIDHLSVSNGLTARGLLETDFIRVNEYGDISIVGTSGQNHGSLNIGFEGGLNNISAGGASISSHIDGAINALNISYDENTRHVKLINTQTGLTSEFDANKFIKDGMIEDVNHKAGGTGIDGTVYPESKGPYIQIIWNTDGGERDTWLRVKEFADLYTTDDPGVCSSDLESFKIALNYNYVARLSDVQDLRTDVGALQTYATELSAPGVGTIAVLSAGVDSALSSNIRTVKYIGHVTLHEDATVKPTFAEILDKSNLLEENNQILNGAAVSFSLFKSSDETERSEGKYETQDHLYIGDGDYVYVHKHGMDPYVQKDEIVVGETVYLADPVHRYDLTDLSTALSGEIRNLSTALSGEIDSLSAELSSEISSRVTISVDGERTGEFRFWHISRDDYHDLVRGEGDPGKYGVSCDPNALYVISSDGGMCMYGQRITDMADGLLSSDAATCGQLSGMYGGLEDRLVQVKDGIISAIQNTLSAESVTDNLSVKLSAVVQCLVDIRNTLSSIQ